MKRMGMVLILMLLVATAAFAADKMQASGPLQAPGPFKATTVAEAKASGVETNVVLSGNVVKVIKENEFLFSDGTGELLVFTNTDSLNTLMDGTKVEVTGLIGQNFMYTEIEAKSVVVVQ